MEYVYSIYNNVKYYYNNMNPATLSGAIDVIVVETPDGSLQATPFHVRFGKWAVFNTDGKYVDIFINDQRIENIKMKLGDNGMAFFVDKIKSAQLKDLKLEYGMNTATFSISSNVQGTATACCHIYLLRSCERIVISDVDGTITKSDVLGHIIPAIGGTWAHTSIVNLYRRIQDNGYRIVYLSSRAIGQSYQTKQYLSSIIQSSKKLPDGPVLLSPASILMAFRKEIIERKPDEFKIACLTNLMSLFPGNCPFYAGFGNRETDIKSYSAVGIPHERIFIIDPAGKVQNASNIGFVTNYGNMLRDNVVDLLFPPLFIHNNSDLNDSTNNSFSFWRAKSDELEDSDMEQYEQKRHPRTKKKSRWYSFY